MFITLVEPRLPVLLPDVLRHRPPKKTPQGKPQTKSLCSRTMSSRSLELISSPGSMTEIVDQRHRNRTSWSILKSAVQLLVMFRPWLLCWNSKAQAGIKCDSSACEAWRTTVLVISLYKYLQPFKKAKRREPGCKELAQEFRCCFADRSVFLRDDHAA
jgi:hypothetical protein